MNKRRSIALAAVLSLFFAAPAAAKAGFSPEHLWQAWPDARFVTTPAPCLRPAELETDLRKLEQRYEGRLTLEEIGRSFQGRAIHMFTLGHGPRKVLLWSQMHGDEPSATPALLDIADYLLANAEQPEAAAILAELTLLMVPMLNPDGSEIYQRRNAQGIDVNRDALDLATPEGRLLKRLRDEHQPILGFNLHDQNRRTAVGDTGVLATNAVLAVAGDPEGTVTAGRRRTRRACAAIVEALAPFVPGGMARYDEDWSPRAFGDNLTAWGTPVVLIESGGLPAGFDFAELTRLNFVAILTVLQGLVRDDLAGYNPQVYEDLKRNQNGSWVDVVVRGGEVLQPGTTTPYRADLAFNVFRDDRELAGCASGGAAGSRIFEAGGAAGSRIFDLGDAGFLGAGREIDATGAMVLAPLVVGVRRWSARRWLDADVLEQLARLGVGTVRWVVERRRWLAAEAVARRLEGRGRARLEPVAAPATLPRLVLDGPPAAPGSDSLGDALAVLGGASSPAALDRPWPEAGKDSLPAIRPGQSASFLIVSPAGAGEPGAGEPGAGEPGAGEPGAGEPDLGSARLVSVWLDGVEVRAEDK